uniref:Uncharacterized protein n=1 Tax=Siphoviridae sp. ctVCm11 TaxID=2826358 RepID=A0A8S5QM53_9CAUD|nr:MAG TPA: hypothetical protein [Siphoviridae sp. ctVCm11]
MRLIDADKLSEAIHENVLAMYEESVAAKEDCLREIEEAPTVDAVVVTRCKDCAHYDMGVCLKIYSDGNVHSAAWQERKPDDFCSYGDPKEGDHADDHD